MPASTQSPPTREARPTPQLAPSPTVAAAPASVPVSRRFTPYWGDSLLFLFWCSCFLLMVLLNFFDAIAGWLRR
jgi:hypothetical protein